MKLLEYGNPENEKFILINGFQAPYQLLEDLIAHYQKEYCVIVPILTGHNVQEEEDFLSLAASVGELEDAYVASYGNHASVVYGISMGGVFASQLWQNQVITMDKLIMESSPLLGFGKLVTTILTKQYLTITHKAQERDAKTLQQAVNSIVTQEKLPIFLELLDHMSDATIANYIREVGNHRLSGVIDTKNTELYYLYGGNFSEILFRKVAKFIEKHYEHATTICIAGKVHCEDVIFHTQTHIQRLDALLGK